jgi:heme/copper-type cytochrome/quinol oxidase subunit 4
MHAIADTAQLVADRVITPDQARTIEARARAAMITLGVNAILFSGILAATAGFIFWLADPLAVALTGGAMIALGLLVLAKGGETYRMFGNASTLIGAGMLIGGAALELADKYEDIAGAAMTAGGGVILLVAGWRYRYGGLSSRFVLGSILLMGLAVHLGGIEFLCQEHQAGSPLRNLIYLYYAAALAAAGWLVDVRLVTALAIVPFAQALETGTSYFHAAYVFYSPEATLSILQMAVLIVICLRLAPHRAERDARHLRILAMLAFAAANLCALVGSLWGDVVGESIWGYGSYWRSDAFDTWEEFETARDAFRETALQIPAGVYSILWAAALAAMVLWAAQRNQRGLFNGALTFGGIHAYTQLFETFGDEPLAYVIGGLAAIPLAWGVWRMNGWMAGQAGS